MNKPDHSARARLKQLRALGSRLWRYEASVINLIASDNAYPARISTWPTYKGHMIQEGLLDKRPFAGAALHDAIERLAQTVACDIFRVAYANLQPHSCSQANQAVYHALLKPGDTVLALNFAAGGHLTHGFSGNFSGRTYRFIHYGLDGAGYIDYGAALEIAKRTAPRLVVCGSSSYPRMYDIGRLRAVAAAAQAPLMLDLSHEAGLIAGGAIENPVPEVDVATMSLDKTLRGPFGAMVLAKSTLSASLDRAIHPGTQSSFSVRRLSDTAHALLLTQTGAFRDYAHSVLANAKILERRFAEAQLPMLTGGTDKHYVVIDVRSRFGIAGAIAERRLEDIGVLTNRQTLPSDVTNRASDASGLRIGTAWATSRGYRRAEFDEIAELIITALPGAGPSARARLRRTVSRLASTKRARDVWRA